MNKYKDEIVTEMGDYRTVWNKSMYNPSYLHLILLFPLLFSLFQDYFPTLDADTGMGLYLHTISFLMPGPSLMVPILENNRTVRIA